MGGVRKCKFWTHLLCNNQLIKGKAMQPVLDTAEWMCKVLTEGVK